MKMPVFRVPRGLLLAFCMSLAFMLVSYAPMLSASQSPLFDHAAYKAVFDGPILGTALSGHLTWFVIWLTLLHLGLGFWCWLLARSTQIVLPEEKQGIRRLVTLWFIATVAWLLVWNSGHYPRSSIGKAYANLLANELLGLELHDWLTMVYVATAAWFLLTAASRRGRSFSQRQQAVVAAYMASPLVVIAAFAWWPHSHVPAAPPDKPNVILLGIDSLRFDEVERRGEVSTTPNIDAFLEGALRFDNAMTPLARTYPSWVSLLTGKHPHTTGAIVNLLNEDHVRLGKTLPMMLRERGYHTAYAIDEVRFSNIDGRYGFDETVTPPIGSADFVIGAISDTPLLNLVGRSKVGEWLFPYGYANRGANLVYDPQIFVNRVREEIDYQSPMFLATHLTLPHWPYMWRDGVLASVFEQHDPSRPGFYRAAVTRADRQFGDILANLEARGMLQNAIVVVLSDHGESFSGEADSIVDAANETVAALGAGQAYGHGTSVLTPHQYRIVLGMRAYGPARALLGPATGVTHVAASIEDITPTIADALKLPATEKFDGVSLLPELHAPGSLQDRLAHRVRFTETEFNPRSLLTLTAGNFAVINANSLADAMNYYVVDPDTDRIRMKEAFLPSLMRNRQFAAVGWTKMIAGFPSPETGAMHFLVLDLKRSEPLTLDGNEDLGQDFEVKDLWAHLCGRFGDILDAGSQPLKCSSRQLAASAEPGH